MAEQRPHYHKWLRYYLDFCHKYSFAPMDRLSLPAFQEKLRAKHQPESLCQQAEHTVSLYCQMVSAGVFSGVVRASLGGTSRQSPVALPQPERLPAPRQWRLRTPEYTLR